jgi:hypothetical protein
MWMIRVIRSDSMEPDGITSKPNREPNSPRTQWICQFAEQKIENGHGIMLRESETLERSRGIGTDGQEYDNSYGEVDLGKSGRPIGVAAGSASRFVIRELPTLASVVIP